MLERTKSAKPLYLQIKDIVKQKIINNEYMVGTTIPSENELEEMFGVSRMTIRQAISELVNEGLLRKERGRGKGTVVLSNAIADRLTTIKSFTQKMHEQGFVLKNKDIDCTLAPAGENVANVFELHPEEEVFCLKRTRMVNKDIIMYSISYVPPFLKLPTEPSLYDSLYKQFSQKQINIKHAEEFIEATLADDDISKKLEVSPGAAVLKRTRTSKDAVGRYVEYTETYYRSDKYKYVVELTL